LIASVTSITTKPFQAGILQETAPATGHRADLESTDRQPVGYQRFARLLCN
jgi:hypothetical protein